MPVARGKQGRLVHEQRELRSPEQVDVERDQRRSEVLRHDDVERVGDGDVVAKGPGLREQWANLNSVGRRGE
jgi:hypothetical protein